MLDLNETGMLHQSNAQMKMETIFLKLTMNPEQLINQPDALPKVGTDFHELPTNPKQNAACKLTKKRSRTQTELPTNPEQLNAIYESLNNRAYAQTKLETNLQALPTNPEQHNATCKLPKKRACAQTEFEEYHLLPTNSEQLYATCELPKCRAQAQSEMETRNPCVLPTNPSEACNVTEISQTINKNETIANDMLHVRKKRGKNKESITIIHQREICRSNQGASAEPCNVNVKCPIISLFEQIANCNANNLEKKEKCSILSYTSTFGYNNDSSVGILIVSLSSMKSKGKSHYFPESSEMNYSRLVLSMKSSYRNIVEWSRAPFGYEPSKTHVLKTYLTYSNQQISAVDNTDNNRSPLKVDLIRKPVTKVLVYSLNRYSKFCYDRFALNVRSPDRLLLSLLKCSSPTSLLHHEPMSRFPLNYSLSVLILSYARILKLMPTQSIAPSVNPFKLKFSIVKPDLLLSPLCDSSTCLLNYEPMTEPLMSVVSGSNTLTLSNPAIESHALERGSPINSTTVLPNTLMKFPTLSPLPDSWFKVTNPRHYCKLKIVNANIKLVERFNAEISRECYTYKEANTGYHCNLEFTYSNSKLVERFNAVIRECCIHYQTCAVDKPLKSYLKPTAASSPIQTSRRCPNLADFALPDFLSDIL